jgi:hypothetical protein
MFGFSIIRTRKLEDIQDKLLKAEIAIVASRERTEEAYGDFIEVSKRALSRSKGCFFTLADNVFFLALKEKPEWLDALKKRLEQVIHLRDNPRHPSHQKVGD